MYIYILIYINIQKVFKNIPWEDCLWIDTFIPLVWTFPVIQKCRSILELFWCFSRYDLVLPMFSTHLVTTWFSRFCVNHVFCHTTHVYGSSWDILRRPSKRDHHGSDPIGDSVSNVRTAPLEIGRAPTTGQGLQWGSWILVRDFSSGSEGKPAMDEWWTLFKKKSKITRGIAGFVF